jgi:hypothetical protein
VSPVPKVDPSDQVCSINVSFTIVYFVFAIKRRENTDANQFAVPGDDSPPLHGVRAGDVRDSQKILFQIKLWL